jgi:hypothetical protein
MNYFVNGNKYEFISDQEFVAECFVGRWTDVQLLDKENICYFKKRVLRKGDKFVITNVLSKRYIEDDCYKPEQIALYCSERNISFLIHYGYFQYHYMPDEKKIRRFSVKRKSKTISKAYYGIKNVKFDNPPLFFWIEAPAFKNYNQLWNILNERL